MSRVYLDASTIIYFVEAESLFHAAAVQSVGRFRSDLASRLVTSRLSCLECRVKPVRDSNEELLAKYAAFFKRRRLVIGDVTPCRHRTRNRLASSPAVPDARRDSPRHRH